MKFEPDHWTARDHAGFMVGEITIQGNLFSAWNGFLGKRKHFPTLDEAKEWCELEQPGENDES